MIKEYLLNLFFDILIQLNEHIREKVEQVDKLYQKEKPKQDADQTNKK